MLYLILLVIIVGEAMILNSLHSLHRKERRILMNEQDLQNSLDQIKTMVGTVITRMTAQAQTIADLQKQIADGTPVTQAQLDALAAEANDIVTSLQPATA